MKYLVQVRNEKARKYLMTMVKKPAMPFSKKFPNRDPLALNLLEKLLAFDPNDRPSAEEVWYHLALFFISHAYESRECACISVYL
jgi:serine/threonine protein kinase